MLRFMGLQRVGLFSRSVVSDSLRPHGPQHARLPRPSLSPRVSQIHVHRVGDAIQPSHPLLSPSPFAFTLSHIRGFSSESALHIRWPKCWSFSFSISPSSEYSGVISFKGKVGVPFTSHVHALEKEMATHSSVLAWKIPGMGEPGGLPSMGLHRVRHDWRLSSNSNGGRKHY